MNILLINDEFYMTGASAALYHLAIHLRNVGHNVSVMPRVNGEGEIRNRYIEAGIPIVSNANQIDVVIANTMAQGETVAKFGNQFPIVWWLHEAEIGRQMILQMPALADGFRKAAHIVFQTTFQKDVYHSFLFDSRTEVSVVPFWSETVYQNRPVPTPSRNGKRRIVAIGTLEPRKRTVDVVAAIESMPEKNKIECTLVGKNLGLLDPATTKIIEANPGRYQIAGELSAAATLERLASADVFVLPSDSESQPLSLFEAFELGVPACITALDTYRHIGIHHGIHALMHPVGNTALLASNFRTLLNDSNVRDGVVRNAKLLIDQKRRVDWKVSFERVIERVSSQRQAVA